MQASGVERRPGRFKGGQSSAPQEEIEDGAALGTHAGIFFSNCAYVILSPIAPTPVPINEPREK